jgi:PAS domain S-box-containing protein
VREGFAAVAPHHDGGWPEALLNVIPTPLLLIEPGSARVFFANRAAHALAGGAYPLGREAAEYHTVYRCFDEHGKRIPNDGMPGVRAARGERLHNLQLDWETPGGLRSLVVNSDTLLSARGQPAVVMTFEDVTELEAARRSERRTGDELRAILEGVADSITAQTPDGRLVYANAAAVRTLGFETADELLQASVAELMSHWEVLDPAGGPFPIERLPGRRALQGEEPEPEIVRFRHGSGGELRWANIKARPIRDIDGTVRLAINVIEDITELKQVEESNRFLAEASRVLAGSLDYEQTLSAIAHLAVPEVADWCAVDLAAEGAPERVAIAHVDPAKIELAHELERRYPTDPNAPGGTTDVMRSGVAEMYADISDEMLAAAARDDEHLHLIKELGMVSVMIVPMRMRDRVLGVITFVSAESGRRFTETDLRVAEDLGLRAATAVENARLYGARSEIARVLQDSLLPPHLPDITGLEVGAMYRAAGEGYEVGGDFYDLFSTDDDHWFAVIGDVCGKGAEAAAVTALARYTIRAAAARRRSPAKILRWVNDAMLAQGAPRFCTVAVAHIDRSGAGVQISVALGGHPQPLMLRADGSVEPIGVPGTLLGLVDQVTVEDTTTELTSGDALLLFTDGITEAGAPAQVWTPEDFEDALGRAAGLSAQGIVDHVAVAALAGRDSPFRDDVAMLALRGLPAASD